ncbi:UNVERIFIED_ORG: hypothetical protein DFO49_3615 [Herbaspirillum seropedicae]
MSWFSDEYVVDTLPLYSTYCFKKFTERLWGSPPDLSNLSRCHSEPDVINSNIGNDFFYLQGGHEIFFQGCRFNYEI